MGSTYEVLIWVKNHRLNPTDSYREVTYWTGDDFDEALRVLTEAKAETGCATLQWRA